MRRSYQSASILKHVMYHGYHSIKISTIVFGELMHGAYKSKFTERTLRETEEFLSDFEIVPFDYDAAVAYGQIKASLERKGEPVGPNDMLIAAAALSRRAVLVTNNINEFSRVEGLALEDWTQSKFLPTSTV